MLLMFFTSSYSGKHFCQVRENISNGFQVSERKRFYDLQKGYATIVILFHLRELVIIHPLGKSRKIISHFLKGLKNVAL